MVCRANTGKGRVNLQWLTADNDEERALLGVLYNGNDGHFSHSMKWDARHLGMKEEFPKGQKQKIQKKGKKEKKNCLGRNL